MKIAVMNLADRSINCKTLYELVLEICEKYVVGIEYELSHLLHTTYSFC